MFSVTLIFVIVHFLSFLVLVCYYPFCNRNIVLISLCYYIIIVYVHCVHHQGDRSERQVCQAGPCTTRKIIIGLVILYTDIEVVILNIAVQAVIF